MSNFLRKPILVIDLQSVDELTNRGVGLILGKKRQLVVFKLGERATHLKNFVENKSDKFPLITDVEIDDVLEIDTKLI